MLIAGRFDGHWVELVGVSAFGADGRVRCPDCGLPRIAVCGGLVSGPPRPVLARICACTLALWRSCAECRARSADWSYHSAVCLVLPRVADYRSSPVVSLDLPGFPPGGACEEP